MHVKESTAIYTAKLVASHSAAPYVVDPSCDLVVTSWRSHDVPEKDLLQPMV